MSSRLDRLLQPAFLLALAVLLLNDHILKDAFASPIPGKLSDVAGLIVLPVLLAALLRIQSRKLVWAVHLAVGLAFAALQFVSESALWAVGLAIQHTPDPTDLVALAILPLGVRLSLAEPRQLEGMRPSFANAVGLVAVGAVLATSPPRAPLVVEPTPVLNASRPQDALDQLDERLVAVGMVIRGDRPQPYEAWIAQHATYYEDGKEAREAHRDLEDRFRERRARGEAEYLLQLAPEDCADVAVGDHLAIALTTQWDPEADVLLLSVSDIQGAIRWRFADDAERDRGRQLVQSCLIEPLSVSSASGSSSLD